MATTFSNKRYLVVFHWNLSCRKSSQVSRSILSFLADLNNAIVWMFSTCPLISYSSSPLNEPLGIVQSVPVTIGITVTFMFHSFFSSLARSKYSSLLSFSFDIHSVVRRNGKVINSAGSLFVYYYWVWSSDLLVICFYHKTAKNFGRLIH